MYVGCSFRFIDDDELAPNRSSEFVNVSVGTITDDSTFGKKYIPLL